MITWIQSPVPPNKNKREKMDRIYLITVNLENNSPWLTKCSLNNK
jgi:hypothetical protein